MKYGTKINPKLKEMYSKKDLAGFSVFDVGCGMGANAKFLADRGATVRAIDNDSEIEIDYDGVYFQKQDIQLAVLKDGYAAGDILLAINVLQFLSIKEIKKIFPYLLDSVADNGILFLVMFDSPVCDWINTQIEDFKVMDYKKWEQKDLKPHPHKHQMVRYVLKK